MKYFCKHKSLSFEIYQMILQCLEFLFYKVKCISAPIMGKVNKILSTTTSTGGGSDNRARLRIGGS